MASYIHEQTVPASTWTVSHNLGTKYVNIEVVVSYLNHYETILPKSVVSLNNSNLQVTFSRSFTGSVRINN